MNLIDAQTGPDTQVFGTNRRGFVPASGSCFGRAGMMINAAIGFVQHKEASSP